MKKQISNYFDKTINFNIITRYLRKRKYHITKSILKEMTLDKEINILDIGCGTASMYEHLCELNINFNYIGLEPDKILYDEALNKYNTQCNFKILNNVIEENFQLINNSDIILAMDVLEHMPYNIRNILIEEICNFQDKTLLINVPNEVGPIIAIKNLGSYLMGYQRYTEYTIMETLNASLYRLDKITHHTIAHKGFDWRTLDYSLRFYFKDKVKIISFINFFPKFLSPSIYFKCN